VEKEVLHLLADQIETHHPQVKMIAGWGAHFAMGIVFASVYVDLWETKRLGTL